MARFELNPVTVVVVFEAPIEDEASLEGNEPGLDAVVVPAVEQVDVPQAVARAVEAALEKNIISDLWVTG